tara:strand:+ start:1017 stop:1154 length:138 start_codon:yes stop_codon:yes gene_type:complete
MQINFECAHCGKINLVNLSDINLGDLAADGVSSMKLGKIQELTLD